MGSSKKEKDVEKYRKKKKKKKKNDDVKTRLKIHDHTNLPTLQFISNNTKTFFF